MKKYKILKDLIGFNTIKDKENSQIINYLEKFLENLNFKTEYKDKVLIMSIGNDAKLGFLGHTDTVEYIDGWNTNPLAITQIDNKIYGLGVCDMKGGIAAMLDAVSQIDFSKLKYGMKLYFTYDEEIGFKGIRELIDMKCEFPKLMIFGEPTNNDILGADELIGRLAKHGHKKIMGIFLSDNHQSGEKFCGYVKALNKYQCVFDDDYIKWCVSSAAYKKSFEKDHTSSCAACRMASASPSSADMSLTMPSRSAIIFDADFEMEQR